MSSAIPRPARHPRRPRNRHLAAILVPALAFAWLPATTADGRGQPDIDNLPDPDPEVQKAAFQLAEGLEINLFAAEPMLRNPVQMNWDDRGRLWVVCSTTYPHLVPGHEADDQVVILEDTTGDGQADKSTVFATGLHIPTGILPVPGGALVANSTEVLLLEDTTGDDRADRRTIVLSGFGTEDTHHLLHTFRMGPTGHVHFKQSIYIHSNVETPYGVRRLDGGGMWHYHPASQRLEIFYKGLINPWGLAFDRRAQAFATDGAGVDGIHDVFPGAIYRTSPGASRVLTGLNPGQPKLCGLDIIESPHWPADWQHSMVTCDFRGGRVNRFEVAQAGSSHRSRQLPDLLSSSHRAFRPVDILQGPDGAIYIADWYNPIIQHGEVDFRDPRRDHQHGRIWRVTMSGRPLDRQPDFRSLDENALAAQLDRPNRWSRDFTRRELGARDPDKVQTALAAWLDGEPAADGIEPWQRLLEAALAGSHLDRPDPALVSRLLAHERPEARAGALRLLYYHHQQFPDIVDLLATAVADPDPSVRLAAIPVLRELKTAQAMETALLALRQDVDEPIDFLLETMAREQQSIWLPEFTAERADIDPDAMVFAFSASGSEDAVAMLLEALATNRVTADQLPAILGVVARAGNQHHQAELFALAEASDDHDLRRAVLDSLRQAAADRDLRPPEDVRPRLLDLLDDDSPAVRQAAVRLVGWWQLHQAGDRLMSWAADPDDRDGGMARAAVESLSRLGGDVARGRLGDLAGGNHPLHVRLRAARGLLDVDHGLAAAAIIEVARAAGGSPDQTAALWTALFQNPAAAGVFKDALGDADLPTDVATEALRIAGSRGVDAAVIEAVQQAGNVQRMDRQLTDDELRRMITRVEQEGDPARGELVYRRTELQCIICHAIGGAGGVIGPDLVSLGASAPVDYIIESMLDVSAVIKEGYHMTVVTTNSGEVFAGGLVLDGDQELVIRDATGTEHTIPTARVTSKTISPVSMMPPGLTNNLREDEFIDLIRFMSELGKDGDYNVGSEPVVRSWRMLAPMEQTLTDMVRHAGLETLELEADQFTWLPITSKVSGDLPLSEVQDHGRMYPWHPKIVQFDLEIGRDEPGGATIEFNDPAGIIVIAGGEIQGDAEPAMRLELDPGTHPVTLVIQTRLTNPHRDLRVTVRRDPGVTAAPTHDR